jgi:anti-sigma factor RsiW
MNEEQQFKLQAFLDGELPEREVREVLALTQHDEDAAQLLAELKNTRQAIAKSESHPALPESREFYWSKIQREIQRLEPRETAAPAVSIFDSLRRWLLPVTAAAALAIAGLIGYQHLAAGGKPVLAEAPQVEMTLADADAVTYQDQEESTTLVWLSYPADEQNKSARAL